MSAVVYTWQSGAVPAGTGLNIRSCGPLSQGLTLFVTSTPTPAGGGPPAADASWTCVV